MSYRKEPFSLKIASQALFILRPETVSVMNDLVLFGMRTQKTLIFWYCTFLKNTKSSVFNDTFNFQDQVIIWNVWWLLLWLYSFGFECNGIPGSPNENHA